MPPSWRISMACALGFFAVAGALSRTGSSSLGARAPPLSLHTPEEAQDASSGPAGTRVESSTYYHPGGPPGPTSSRDVAAVMYGRQLPREHDTFRAVIPAPVEDSRSDYSDHGEQPQGSAPRRSPRHAASAHDYHAPSLPPNKPTTREPRTEVPSSSWSTPCRQTRAEEVGLDRSSFLSGPRSRAEEVDRSGGRPEQQDITPGLGGVEAPRDEALLATAPEGAVAEAVSGCDEDGHDEEEGDIHSEVGAPGERARLLNAMSRTAGVRRCSQRYRMWAAALCRSRSMMGLVAVGSIASVGLGVSSLCVALTLHQKAAMLNRMGRVRYLAAVSGYSSLHLFNSARLHVLVEEYPSCSSSLTAVVEERLRQQGVWQPDQPSLADQHGDAAALSLSRSQLHSVEMELPTLVAYCPAIRQVVDKNRMTATQAVGEIEDALSSFLDSDGALRVDEELARPLAEWRSAHLEVLRARTLQFMAWEGERLHRPQQTWPPEKEKALRSRKAMWSWHIMAMISELEVILTMLERETEARHDLALALSIARGIVSVALGSLGFVMASHAYGPKLARMERLEEAVHAHAIHSRNDMLAAANMMEVRQQQQDFERTVLGLLDEIGDVSGQFPPLPDVFSSSRRRLDDSARRLARSERRERRRAARGGGADVPESAGSGASRGSTATALTLGSTAHSTLASSVGGRSVSTTAYEAGSEAGQGDENDEDTISDVSAVGAGEDRSNAGSPLMRAVRCARHTAAGCRARRGGVAREATPEQRGRAVRGADASVSSEASASPEVSTAPRAGEAGPL